MAPAGVPEPAGPGMRDPGSGRFGFTSGKNNKGAPAARPNLVEPRRTW